MLKISNTLRYRNNVKNNTVRSEDASSGKSIRYEKVALNAKLLAWGIFLIFFIENGTIGLLPKQAYFVYRNVRISDLLLYFLAVYSLFNTKEFAELYKSRNLII